MEVDPPVPEFTFTPTTAYEMNWVRSWGQAFCLDNGVDEVEFDYSFAHQWDQHVVVNAKGFMSVEGLDLSPEKEKAEVLRTHGQGH